MPRPRKPNEKHILDGTYRKDRHGPLTADDAPQQTPPEKPADLTGEAGKRWDQLTGLLLGVARDRDAPLLAEMCRMWAELKRVQGALKKTTPGAKGYNGLLIASGILLDKVDKIGSRFGLTPADRAKLKSESAGPQVARVRVRQPSKLDLAGKPK